MIKTVAMLLPTLGSRDWMEGLIETDGQSVFTSAEQRALKGMARIRSNSGDGMLTLLASTWNRDHKLVEGLREPLTRLSVT